MHYHDPDRPRSAGGLPQFLPPGWGIVPMWEVRFGIEPAADGLTYVEISAWFLTAPTSASRRSHEIPLTELLQFATAWLEDPETVAGDAFGYSGPRAPEPLVVSRAPSLEDLDL